MKTAKIVVNKKKYKISEEEKNQLDILRTKLRKQSDYCDHLGMMRAYGDDEDTEFLKKELKVKNLWEKEYKDYYSTVVDRVISEKITKHDKENKLGDIIYFLYLCVHKTILNPVFWAIICLFIMTYFLIKSF